MLFLKEINLADAQKEYEVIHRMPEDENGFMNPDHDVSYKTFVEKVIPGYIDASVGIHLKEGYVPSTKYFLWEDEHIVGVFNFRHYLNAYLKEGAGHIGYSILPEYRGKGYGTKGLRLLLEMVDTLVPEDEIYMSCAKSNTASLHVMLNNGAYIHHEDEKEYYTRIKKATKSNNAGK